MSFEVHATQSQKQDAIRSVSGLVVGGAAGSVEGLYVVEVDGDGTLTTIESIAGRLRDLPQVRDAHPFSLMRSR